MIGEFNILDNLSYLAGIIDGEGHVAFSGCGKGKKRFVIEVSMTDENVINWLHQNYGGSLRHISKRQLHWKDQWKWRIQGIEAKILYTELKPLLKIKNLIEF